VESAFSQFVEKIEEIMLNPGPPFHMLRNQWSILKHKKFCFGALLFVTGEFEQEKQECLNVMLLAVDQNITPLF
jgi:hypothetical protein